MKTLPAGRLSMLGSHLENTLMTAKQKADKELTDSDREKLLGNLAAIKDELQDLGLESPVDQLERIVEAVRSRRATPVSPTPLTGQHLAQMFRELHLRFEDELARQLCFIVPRDKAKFYEGPHLFGDKVSEAFPSATLDIEEAGKCLALHRGTAAVFHLMRVTEAGLRQAAQALGIPYAPSWESYLRQLNAELSKEWKDKSPAWRKREPFYRDVHAHLHAVKLAWRNPTMHIVQHYTPDVAEEIFGAVRGFMRHLSTKLHEPRRRSRK